MKSVLAALLGLLIALPLELRADDLRHLQSVASSKYHRLESATVDRDFHIYIALPDDYDAAAEGSYPAIYILDGGALYPMLLGYYRYLRLAEDVPDSIVVGISYGNDDFSNGNYRSTDYTAPAADRDYWGGAAVFQQMLETELLPYIESTYRADSAERVIFGQSIGGQFVLYSALTNPDLFHGHIASNPALHRNLPFFTQQRPSDAPSDTGSRLFVSSGSQDDPRFREPALQWMDYWSAQANTPWRLKVSTLDGHNHFSAAPIAFRDGLVWLFSE